MNRIQCSIQSMQKYFFRKMENLCVILSYFHIVFFCRHQFTLSSSIVDANIGWTDRKKYCTDCIKHINSCYSLGVHLYISWLHDHVCSHRVLTSPHHYLLQSQFLSVTEGVSTITHQLPINVVPVNLLPPRNRSLGWVSPGLALFPPTITFATVV